MGDDINEFANGLTDILNNDMPVGEIVSILPYGDNAAVIIVDTYHTTSRND